MSYNFIAKNKISTKTAFSFYWRISQFDPCKNYGNSIWALRYENSQNFRFHASAYPCLRNVITTSYRKNPNWTSFSPDIDNQKSKRESFPQEKRFSILKFQRNSVEDRYIRCRMSTVLSIQEILTAVSRI